MGIVDVELLPAVVLPRRGGAFSNRPAWRRGEPCDWGPGSRSGPSASARDVVSPLATGGFEWQTLLVIPVIRTSLQSTARIPMVREDPRRSSGRVKDVEFLE